MAESNRIRSDSKSSLCIQYEYLDSRFCLLNYESDLQNCLRLIVKKRNFAIIQVDNLIYIICSNDFHFEISLFELFNQKIWPLLWCWLSFRVALTSSYMDISLYLQGIFKVVLKF